MNNGCGSLTNSLRLTIMHLGYFSFFSFFFLLYIRFSSVGVVELSEVRVWE